MVYTSASSGSLQRLHEKIVYFLLKKTNLLMLRLHCLRWLRCYAGTTYPELTYLGQRRMKKAFGQKVRPRGYQVGELVLKRFLPPNTDHRGKWTPNYEGPYVVKRIFYGGVLMLTTMDGEGFPSPINSDAVKKNTSHKIDPLDDKKNSPGKKMGIPANQENEKGSGKS